MTTLARTKLDWDIIALTECWLPNTHNIPELTNYNHYLTNNNHTQNEGVVLYVHKKLQLVAEEPSFLDANCLQVKIDRNTVLLAIYRPPGYKDLDNFLNSLNDTLNKLSKFNTIIIAGDININIHDHSKDPAKHSYLNLLATHGLLPAHTLPTRQQACLDHVMLKTRLPASTSVAHSALTDHETVMLFLSKQMPKIIRKNCIRFNYAKIDTDLRELDFSEVYKTQDPHEAGETITRLIKHVIDSNAQSVKTPNRKQILKPWITPGLLRCMRHRDTLHRKFKKAPNNEILKITFTRYRNYCNKLLRNLKIEFEKNEIKKAGKNTKQLWSAINNISSRSTRKANTSAQLLALSSTPQNSVNHVNDFFAKIGEKLAKNIKSTHTNATNGNLTNRTQSMVMLPTDEEEVARILMSLRNSCAAGWDGISSDLLKKHTAVIVPPLTYIYNLALSAGKFPNVFKKAIIHPIHKSGDRSRVDNYRPISVLTAFSKILERIMNNRLVNYLENNNLIAPAQFGFRTGKSTSDAVHELTDYVVTNMDSGDKVMAIFLDLAKAFDTVSVPILVRKMESLGIRGLPLDLFKDYLSERTQRVKIEEFISDEQIISYGTPQGSVLGPSLFLIYINDLGTLTIPNGKIISFADDTALLFSARSWEDVYEHAQLGFNTVSNWLRDNLLTLNATKTNYIAFCMKNIGSNQPLPNTIVAHSCTHPLTRSCNCQPLNKAENVKYLGITIDKNLRFQDHITTLSNRLRKLIYVFRTLRPVVEKNILKSVYYALAQSIICYCITSWGGAPKTTLIEIERAQRAILKVLSFLPYRYPTEQLYKENKVLTVRQLFVLHTLLKQHTRLVYNPKLSKGKRRYDPVETHHLRRKTIFARRFFCYLGGYLYNKTHKVLHIFNLTKSKCKKRLTDWLLNLNYNDTENLLIKT